MAAATRLLTSQPAPRYRTQGSVHSAQQLQPGDTHFCAGGLEGTKAGTFTANAVLDRETNLQTGVADILFTYTYGHEPGTTAVGRITQV